MNIFVFDIETIPDIDGGRRLYNLDGLSDKEVGTILFHKRRQETGTSEFLRHHMHRIVAISVVLRTHDRFKVWSLGNEDSDEKELLQRFFDGIDRYTPTLVSWNGSGFDLPVIHYRSLANSVSAKKYWDVGDDDRDFKWNNYISRYHWRHIDLMDVIAGFQPRANAPLDEIATLLGFPGKMGMSGAAVWDNFLDSNLKGIRDYCETDVLNTYLVYLRFQLMRGQMDAEQYRQECEFVRQSLQAEDKPHIQQFLDAWAE
ncbi:MAG: 3'-5' exonuclease [Gammaproteobacteria bacterium]|nr:3'-5' exonuclease [Gammaproteobacteria bacterium]MDH5693601.1 3'-5' exonuclease [Gammaproteobacteria bacterium]